MPIYEAVVTRHRTETRLIVETVAVTLQARTYERAVAGLTRIANAEHFDDDEYTVVSSEVSDTEDPEYDVDVNSVPIPQHDGGAQPEFVDLEKLDG